MPFKSKAQMRKFGAMARRGEISKAEFEEWLRETPNVSKLPERVKKRDSARDKGRRRKLHR